MDDFPGLSAKDFRIKPQGKSAPMAPPKIPPSSSKYGFGSEFTRYEYANSKSSSNSIFDDYDGQYKYSSEPRAAIAQTLSSKLLVYDDDVFDGLPGIKSYSMKRAVKYDDVFKVSGSSPKHKSLNSSPFDDLTGNPGSKETEMGS